MSRPHHTRPETPPHPFAGVTSPNTTQVPDQYLDELLPVLSGAELKVLLYITRRTFGFKKSSDEISLSQLLTGITTRAGQVLDRGTGLSKKTLLQAIRSLVRQGIIVTERRQSAERGYEPTSYRLNIRTTEEERSPLGEKRPQGGGGESPPSPWGENSPTQQTGKQHTENSLSIIRTTSRPEENNDGLDDATRIPATGRVNSKPTPLGNLTHPRATVTTGMVTVAEAIAQRQHHHSVARRPAPESPERQGDGTRTEPTHRIHAGGPRQVVQQDEVYQVIQAYIADFRRELNDRAPLKSSTTRAYNLYTRSGLNQDAFIAQLYAARAIVKERAAMIRPSGNDPAAGFPIKHRAGYYFAVLEDLLGFRESPEAPGNPTAATEPDA